VPGAARTGAWGRLLVSFLCRLVLVCLRSTRRIEVRGTLPPSPCVAVSLHRSYWDGVLVCALDPRITAVTSRAWRSVPGIGAFLDRYGVVWTGEDTVARAARAVAGGGICWLAPCGFARSGTCPRPHTGAAQIARATGAPVVCVTLVQQPRPRFPLGRRRQTILIGQPDPTAAGEPVTARTDRLVARLRAEERRATRGSAGGAGAVRRAGGALRPCSGPAFPRHRGGPGACVEDAGDGSL
jgi:1-acyl-sn-glycerol-3-phosphate acyltransferase